MFVSSSSVPSAMMITSPTLNEPVSTTESTIEPFFCDWTMYVTNVDVVDDVVEDVVDSASRIVVDSFPLTLKFIVLLCAATLMKNSLPSLTILMFM